MAAHHPGRRHATGIGQSGRAVVRCRRGASLMGAASWLRGGYAGAHAARTGREIFRVCSVTIAFTAFCLAACAPTRAATASPLHRLVLRLPHTAVETGRAQRRSVVGSATLQVPTAWKGGGLTHGGTVDQLHVTVSASCAASIEATTWVGQLKRSPVLEIESTVGSWYSTFAQPAPVPLVTFYTPGARSPHRVWQLDAAQPSSTPQPASSQESPLYGVLLARLHPRGLWASLMLGVRTTSTCTGTLADRSAPLAQELETIMLSTVFKATAG